MTEPVQSCSLVERVTGDGAAARWIRAHFDYSETDWCLYWPFSRNENGYGLFGTRSTKVHRIMCEYGECCVCPTTEKALRAILHADLKMTEEQREWCKREIDKVEGHGRNDYIDADDSTIAGGVLNAWVDYARDKGLL